MANVNRPSGLAPVMYLNGSPWNGQARTYWISSTDTSVFAPGDPVVWNGSGDARFGIPQIALAAASASAVTGAVLGAGGLVYGGGYFDPNNLTQVVIPSAKLFNYYVLVADDPDLLFEIQEGGSGSALTAADVGANFYLKSGTNNGYVSGWLLDNATNSTTSTYQLKTWGLVERSDNAFGTYAKWLVSINNHTRRPGTAGY